MIYDTVLKGSDQETLILSKGTGMFLIKDITVTLARGHQSLKGLSKNEPTMDIFPIESFHVKRSNGRAGSVSDLLHSLIIYLFQQE